MQQYRRNFEHERSGITKANTRIYRASQVDCGACALKQKCCPRSALAQSRFQRARSRAQRGQTHQRHARISAITPRPEEGRDAVRPFEAHLEAGSPQAAWSFRRTRRIYAGRRRAEPSQVGDARIPSTAAGATGGMRKVATPAALGARTTRARNPSRWLNALAASAQPVVQQNSPREDMHKPARQLRH